MTPYAIARNLTHPTITNRIATITRHADHNGEPTGVAITFTDDTILTCHPATVDGQPAGLIWQHIAVELTADGVTQTILTTDGGPHPLDFAEAIAAITHGMTTAA